MTLPTRSENWVTNQYNATLSMKLILPLFLIVICLSTYAQNDIEVTSDWNADKEDYIFTIRNNTSKPKTVILTFTSLSNLAPSTSLPAIIEVGPNSSRKALTLSKTGIGRPNYRYNTRYYTGCARPEHDEDVLYALPVSKNKTTQPLPIVSLSNYVKDEENPENWNAVGFKMEAGDTIFSVRRGVIHSVTEDNVNNDANVTFTRNTNRLIIRHEDCTFARYANFGTKEIFVKEGQRVEVGDPLGIVNPTPYGSSIQVRMLYYMTPIEKQIKAGNTKMKNEYFPITYATEEGNIKDWNYGEVYTATLTDELVMQEMSKREKKKWLKNR